MQYYLTPPIPEFDEIETKLATHLVDAYADYANLAGNPDKIQALLDTWADETNEILTRRTATWQLSTTREGAAGPAVAPSTHPEHVPRCDRLITPLTMPSGGRPDGRGSATGSCSSCWRRSWPCSSTCGSSRPARRILMSLFEWELVEPAEQFVGPGQLRQPARATRTSGWRSSNTTVFAVVTTVISVALALVLAALLARTVSGRLGGCIELLYFAPVLVPMVPVTLGWREIFNYQHGILNSALGLFGIAKVPWLTDPTSVLAAVIILSVWKQLGYNLIILIVGMRAIPRVYHEAAAVDGASAWQQFRCITLPLLAPVTLFVIVVTTITSFNVFTQVYVLASDVQGVAGQAGPGAWSTTSSRTGSGSSTWATQRPRRSTCC